MSFLSSCTTKKLVDDKLPLLKVSENNRFLITENGDPFFWLGDTGWLLFSKLTREEAEIYLENRAKKGFNVVQAMVLHSMDLVNIYGDSALINQDATTPNVTPGSSFENADEYDFWDHIDYIISLAEKKGIYMALVPTWGANVKGGHINAEQGEIYAAWLAKRYTNSRNIIWLNGGDTKGNEALEIWNTIGNNIRLNDPNHLITFHPFGRMQSSTWFHNEEWLDFNMFQSGHRRYDQDDSEKGYAQDNWNYVRDDLMLSPQKPTNDGEPSYEGIPQGLHDPSEPFWNNNDLRRYAYWSVFAGAFGFTYGNNAVMQMHKPEDKNPAYGAKNYWTEAIDDHGSAEMIHLKNLILSVPYFERIPDQSIIAKNEGLKYDFQVATRGKNYAFIYTFNGREMEIQMGIIGGAEVNAEWYNPRNGDEMPIGEFENKGVKTFDPPGEIADGNDWVLVLKSKI